MTSKTFWIFVCVWGLVVCGSEKYTRTFKQNLDHYSPFSQDKWDQRYFVRDEFFDLRIPKLSRHKNAFNPNDKNSFVFLCVGGEGPPLDESVVTEVEENVHCAHMVHLAKEYKALIVAIEHRYYGSSTPTATLSNKNLKYLSSEQALRDTLEIYHQVMQDYNLDPSKTKWITFGGSYPGMMASFLRVKFPHLFVGSIASSAPVQAVLDFSAFYDVVKQSYALETVGGSAQCVENIRASFGKLNNFLTSTHFLSILWEKFGLCENYQIYNSNNQNFFMESLISLFQIQENDPSCTDELCNIEKTCAYFNSPSLTAIEKLGNLFKAKIFKSKKTLKLLNDKKPKCFNLTYEDEVKALDNPSDLNGDRVWTFQTCTEWGFYQTCKKDCLFYTNDNILTVDYFIRKCAQAFGITKKKSTYEKRINMTNYIFGGNEAYKKGVTNILYVNGEVDPWRAASVLEETKDSFVVKGASHHFWTHMIKKTDSKEVQDARSRIKSVVHSWLFPRDEEAVQDPSKFIIYK